MRQFSLKRQQQEKRLTAVVADIRKVRGGKCEDCEKPGITDPSHNYSRKDFASLISNPENITLLCRRHHNHFADNHLWEFKTEKIFRHMKDQYENEPDQFKAISMRQHLIGKLQIAKEIADLWGNVFPVWGEELLSEIEF